jgi:hypothetical protein
VPVIHAKTKDRNMSSKNMSNWLENHSGNEIIRDYSCLSFAFVAFIYCVQQALTEKRMISILFFLKNSN